MDIQDVNGKLTLALEVTSNVSRLVIAGLAPKMHKFNKTERKLAVSFIERSMAQTFGPLSLPADELAAVVLLSGSEEARIEVARIMNDVQAYLVNEKDARSAEAESAGNAYVRAVDVVDLIERARETIGTTD